MKPDTRARRDRPSVNHAMLGAERLAELTGELEVFLVRGRIAAAAGLLPGIRREAAAVVTALRLVDGESTGPRAPS